MCSEQIEAAEHQTPLAGDLDNAIISAISHEMRIPLYTIQGCIGLLCNGDLGDLAPDQREALLGLVNLIYRLRAVADRIDTSMAVESPVGVSDQRSPQGMAEDGTLSGAAGTEAEQVAIDRDVLPDEMPADDSSEQVATPQRILIVDDEENVALTIKDGLERLSGNQVVIARGGDEALAMFEETPFDLLITDYKMPGMDGAALVARVRQLYPCTAIIMITAYGDELLWGDSSDAPVECILDKPVSLSEIRSATLDALRKKPAK